LGNDVDPVHGAATSLALAKASNAASQGGASRAGTISGFRPIRRGDGGRGDEARRRHCLLGRTRLERAPSADCGRPEPSSAVAGKLAGTDTALGVLPRGTLNHFAKDVGVPRRARPYWAAGARAGGPADQESALLSSQTRLAVCAVSAAVRLSPTRASRAARRAPRRLFIAIGHVLAESTQAFQAAFTPHTNEIMGDIPNFTKIQPTIQISEVKQ
jgi:uncharacterized protein (TIGR02118 family)